MARDRLLHPPQNSPIATPRPLCMALAKDEMPTPTPKHLAWVQKGQPAPSWPQSTRTAQMWNGSWPCIHMQTDIHMHEDMQTHAHTGRCMHTYTWTCTELHVNAGSAFRHAHEYTRRHAHICTHMHTCILACISPHANMNTYGHTHRHMHNRLQMPRTPQHQGSLSQPYNYCWSHRGQFGAGKQAHTASPACSYGALLYAPSFPHPMGHEEGLQGEKSPPTWLVPLLFQ